MSSNNDDLIIAQNILERSYFNFGNNHYNDYSPIYKVSNEKISTPQYKDSLSNKKKILSVIGSGDQILNSILFGTQDIDAYDISRFSKYFLCLKMAGILSLNKEEFIKFFIENPDYKEIFSYDIYEKLRVFLSPESLKFWDGLFDYFDGYEIYNSTLFSSETYSKSSQILMNPYLEEENYQNLKRKINDINIRFYEGNIFKIVDSFKDGYDLINLSSIVYYLNDTYPSGNYKDYLEFLHRLPLKEEGIAITYLYDVLRSSRILAKELSNDQDISINTFEFIDGPRKDAILTYQKRK